MSQIIPQTSENASSFGQHSLSGKMFPNGEVVLYKARNRPRKALKEFFGDDFRGGYKGWACVAMFQLGVLPAKAALMGLSTLANFDKTIKSSTDGDCGQSNRVSHYGRSGITSFGRRRVRNACHLLQRGNKRYRCVFATCTVPNLPLEQMRRVHEGWNRVVEAYRRKLSRLLKDKGLRGDSVTVSELQEKRYEKSGVPVLHIHTVFVGKCGDGQWAVTPETHDKMWLESLQLIVPEMKPDIGSACNLQRVRQSAEGYLGKYMSKGADSVRALCDEGFAGWLPKQWWNCTRTLSKAIDAETRDIAEFASYLCAVACVEGDDTWIWHRDVLLEGDGGDVFTIARYGKIKAQKRDQILSDLGFA